MHLGVTIRLHVLEIEAIEERSVDADLVLSLLRRLEVRVAERVLGDSAGSNRIRLVLVFESGAESCCSACCTKLELLESRNLEVVGDSPRTRNVVVVRPAIVDRKSTRL